MPYYALRSRKTGALLTCLAASVASDDGGEFEASRRIIEVHGAILVGDYASKTLFVTQDLDTATLLVRTGEGHEHRNSVVLRPTYDTPLSEIEVVTLPDLAPVPLDPVSPEVEARLAALDTAGTPA